MFVFSNQQVQLNAHAITQDKLGRCCMEFRLVLADGFEPFSIEYKAKLLEGV